MLHLSAVKVLPLAQALRMLQKVLPLVPAAKMLQVLPKDLLLPIRMAQTRPQTATRGKVQVP